MIYELTWTTHSSSMPMLDVPAAICGPRAAVTQGLYVFRFANTADEDILDSNKKPKIVVHRRGASIKPGKFEGGLAARVENYNVHLHRPGADGRRQWALGESFRGGFLLDLSAAEAVLPRPARVFERYWNEAVNRFLAEHGLLAHAPVTQLARAEWRYVQAERWTDGVTATLLAYLNEVSKRISAMIEVGAFPAVRPADQPT